MEQSRYNVVIPYHNYLIIYNTLWNTIVYAQNDNESIMNLTKKEKLPNNWDNIPSILLEKKIIVESTDLEIKHIRDLITQNMHNRKVLDIVVLPTLACNYKCWYCYENHKLKNSQIMSISEVEAITKYIYNSVNQNPEIKIVHIRFFGGEPFLYYNEVIKPLLENIKKISDELGVLYMASATTNGSLIKQEDINFLVNHRLNHLQITLDGNKERHNKVRFSRLGDNSYDTIVNNIKAVNREGIKVSVRLNISEETRLDVGKLLDDFLDVSHKELLTFSIHKVWQAKKEVIYTIDQIVNQIRKAGFYCVSYYSAPSSIWKTCYADKENEIVIKPGGYVYKCTARDFTQERAEGRLMENGNIQWNERYFKRSQLSVLDNPECMKCAIMPICIGGCKQKIIEHGNNRTCIRNFTESDKREYAQKVLFEKLERITP